MIPAAQSFMPELLSHTRRSTPICDAKECSQISIDNSGVSPYHGCLPYNSANLLSNNSKVFQRFSALSSHSENEYSSKWFIFRQNFQEIDAEIAGNPR